jgi:hypothetical protein
LLVGASWNAARTPRLRRVLEDDAGGLDPPVLALVRKLPELERAELRAGVGEPRDISGGDERSGSEVDQVALTVAWVRLGGGFAASQHSHQ